MNNQMYALSYPVMVIYWDLIMQPWAMLHMKALNRGSSLLFVFLNNCSELL